MNKDYILFKLYHYYDICISFKKKTNPFLKLRFANELVKKMRELIIIC